MLEVFDINQCQYPSLVGIDVHKEKNVACYYKPNGHSPPTMEFATFDTFESGCLELVTWIKRHGAEAAIMESTGSYWITLDRAIQSAGLKCIVANPAHVRGLPGHKTDMADSLWLAKLGIQGMVKPSFIPSPEVAAFRSISRKRQDNVRELAKLKNRKNKALVECGIRIDMIASDINGKTAKELTAAILNGGSPLEAAKLAGNRLKAPRADILRALSGKLTPDDVLNIREFDRTIEYFEELVQEQSDRLVSRGRALFPEQMLLLETIPGIKEGAAAAILAEIGGDMSQFMTSERLASWAGVCPGNNESAGKRKSGKTTKGNIALRRALTECAHAAIKTPGSIKDKYQSLRGRKIGYKKAIVAIAHKLLRIIFAMLSRKEPYRDASVSYRELLSQKIPPRWVKKLAEYYRQNNMTLMDLSGGKGTELTLGSNAESERGMADPIEAVVFEEAGSPNEEKTASKEAGSKPKGRADPLSKPPLSGFNNAMISLFGLETAEALSSARTKRSSRTTSHLKLQSTAQRENEREQEN
jgi:transposase